MTNNELCQEFIAHLNKVCKDKEYYAWAVEYFKFLMQSNHKITKDNLDTLTLSRNETYNLDLENDLFKDKQVITVAELFLHNFIHFVKKVAPLNETEYAKKSDNDGTSGFYAHKYLGIFCDKDFKGHKFQTITLINPQKNSCEELDKWYLRKTFWHELSHILQLKTFNKNIFGMGFDEQLIEYKNPQHTKESYLSNLSSIENEFIRDMIKKGSYLITEILNEYAVNHITNSLEIVKVQDYLNIPVTNNMKGFRYAFSIRNDNFISIDTQYLNLMFILPMLQIILDDNFSPNDANLKCFFYGSQLSKIGLDDDLDSTLTQRLAKMLKTYKNIPESETTKNLDKISYFKLFEFIIGARDNCTDHKIATNELQAMLINLYKNKFLAEFEDASVIKDEHFFCKVNTSLETIAKFFHFNWEMQVAVFDQETKTTKTLTANDMPIFSEFGKLNSTALNIQEFNRLINTIKSKVSTLENKDLANSKLEFIKKQDALAKRYMLSLPEKTKEK